MTYTINKKNDQQMGMLSFKEAQKKYLPFSYKTIKKLIDSRKIRCHQTCATGKLFFYVDELENDLRNL